MKIPFKKIPFKMKTTECKVPATKDIAKICMIIETFAIGLSKQKALSIKETDEKIYKKAAREAKDFAKELDKFIVKMATKLNKTKDTKKDFLSVKGKPVELYIFLENSDATKYRKLYKKLSNKYEIIKQLIENLMVCYDEKGKMLRTSFGEDFNYKCDFGKCFKVLNPDEK